MPFDFTDRVPAYAFAVMDALTRAGHKGYLVGGSLRDLLRGETPHDFDMTTDADPEEMLEVFADFRVFPTGLKHGTLTVLSEGKPVEVTTHRVDGAYLDARRPESVSFTRRLSDDLSRRDFTVNAMAWHPETGLVDLFGGREDLERGIIRTVGDPVARFREDALRILRAFRFSAQLNFEIEPATLAGAAACREGLKQISAERVFSEMSRLLATAHAVKGIRALVAAGCEKQVFFDTVPCLNALEQMDTLAPEATLRLAFLLREHTPEAAVALCRRWRSPNAFGDEVGALLGAYREAVPTSLYTARRFVCQYWRGWQGALAMRAALGEDVAEVAKMCKTVSKNGTAVEIKRLAVNGKELQEAVGVRLDKTGVLLRMLQDLCWQEPKNNKKATLTALAAEIVAKNKDFL